MTPTDDLRTWMRTKRRSLGMTQTELGHLTGMHQTHIARIETGKQGITWDQGWAIINALEQPRPNPAGPPPIHRPGY